ncbi:MAG: hypothetical protein MUE85_10795 [Microscillaceae bacterium]|jgi:uncharacterized tellurite resistance protein B-like protein|nr:hypothetical protein [Microscillaceae bacterium]
MEKAKALIYFQNLYLIAIADHHLANSEKQKLLRFAHQIGLETAEAEDIMANPTQRTLIIPENKADRIQQLEDIVKMMLIDQQIHDAEYKLCLAFTERIGYSKITLDNIIQNLTRNN